MTLQKSDTIQNRTTAHVHNGYWTHYFQRDAVTGKLLALINAPSGWEISEINPNSTYNDLHADNHISLSEKVSPKNKCHLPDSNARVITLSSKQLYTDGKRVLTTGNNTYVVADAHSFKRCPIQMIDDITQEKVTVMMSDLYSSQTPRMCVTLYQLATSGTTAEKSYMRVSRKHSQRLKHLVDTGELICALNNDDDTAFMSLFERIVEQDPHSKDYTVNVPGRYFLDGSDIQYFIELNADRKHITFKETHNTLKELIVGETNVLSIEDVKKAIQHIWFDHSRKHQSVLSLISILHRMAYYKAWQPTSRKDLSSLMYLGISKYYYYNT